MRIARQCKNKKLFYKTTTATIFHRTQINVPQPFSNITCRCELAVQHPFFETSQSCVSSTVTLSLRFKSSPAIPGKAEISGAAGYLMNAGHFRRNLVSSGDLNRPRSPEVRKPLACFLCYFLHDAKSDNSFSLQRTSRFCKPRISAPKPKLCTNPIKSFAASRQCPCRDSTLPRAFSAALGGIFRPLRGNSYFL